MLACTFLNFFLDSIILSELNLVSFLSALSSVSVLPVILPFVDTEAARSDSSLSLGAKLGSSSAGIVVFAWLLLWVSTFFTLFWISVLEFLCFASASFFAVAASFAVFWASEFAANPAITVIYSAVPAAISLSPCANCIPPSIDNDTPTE